MKLAAPTCHFKTVKTQKEKIKHLYDAGFRNIDLTVYSIQAVEDIISDDWESFVYDLGDYAEKLGVKFVQSHTSDIGLLTRTYGYDKAVEITKRTINVCGMLGIPNTVVHSVVGDDKADFYAKNLPFYQSLYDTMEKNNVEVLIENNARSNIGDKYFVFSGADVVELIESLSHPLIHACWDTGHANIHGNQYDHIVTLGPHLHAIHLNDNRGHVDEHMIPYLGTFNLDEIINALIDIDYKGYFTFEADNSVMPGDAAWPHQKIKFEKDTRLKEAPMFMRDELEKLLYKIGKYALEAYGIFEE